jgi:hypothetical protein
MFPRQIGYPLSFRGQVCGTQSSLPCFSSMDLIAWRPPSLRRVPLSAVWALPSRSIPGCAATGIGRDEMRMERAPTRKDKETFEAGSPARIRPSAVAHRFYLCLPPLSAVCELVGLCL